MDDIKKDQHFWHAITGIAFLFILAAMVGVLYKFGRIPNNIPLFDFFMLVFATFRITRLLVHDLVSDFIRDPFDQYAKGLGNSIKQLLGCPWCTGMWVALGTGFFYFTVPFAWPVLLIFAIAGLGTVVDVLASMMMVTLNKK